jgi:hypothetical protein
VRVRPRFGGALVSLRWSSGRTMVRLRFYYGEAATPHRETLAALQ